VLDAAGLALFAASGTLKALDLGLNSPTATCDEPAPERHYGSR
jgi:uncharacterized membrane protein YeiH